MTEPNWSTIAQWIGLLLGGGGGGLIINKWLTGGDARLADGAAVRNELWERVEGLEKKQEELSAKYQNEHDDRVRLESFIGAFVQAYGEVRGRSLRMVQLFRENDDGWRVWAAELEATPDAEMLFARIVTGKHKTKPEEE